ncbi:phosphotransferase family protein [Primorskyibacter sp. 2E233]|uniref:phosphotransferase family protein n=1 Tax=Primorskyibacter sp. 2E233 TaxID=3413431 RepID=UPI003BF2DB8B
MSSFIKTFADAAQATEAARRSMDLRQQSVITPPAYANGQTVVFAGIAGCSGLPLTQRPIDDWLAPLIPLHTSVLDGLSPFDPMLRISPRLDLLTNPSLRAALHRLAQASPRGGSVIHGDFHLGQVIAAQDGVAWLIDLDDLAIGPVEADIGNLIANLATQDDLPGPFAVRLEHWRQAVQGEWFRLDQTANPTWVEHFAALALIRRHLKLREQARRDFEADIAAWITPDACRTSPFGNAAYPD